MQDINLAIKRSDSTPKASTPRSRRKRFTLRPDKDLPAGVTKQPAT
jgi:hypothetical protein